MPDVALLEDVNSFHLKSLWNFKNEYYFCAKSVIYIYLYIFAIGMTIR